LRIVNGYYTLDAPPNTGLAAARMSALLTYRSRNSFESRFGRKTMQARPVSKVLEESQAGPNPPSSTQAIIHNEGNQIRLHGTKPSAPSTTETRKESRAKGQDWGQETGLPLVYSAQSYLRYQGDKFVKYVSA
jgi:homoserine O-acetyltransferase